MANHPAAPLLLRQGDRETLQRLVRSTSVRAGLAQRARIVLLAAEGISNTEIAQKVGTTRNTVIVWRARYEQAGVKGLADRDRSGRPRRLDHRTIVAATLTPPPKKLGVTHWSSRLLAARLGIDHTTVAKAWREYGVHPWREGTFKFSTDPELVAKVVDVVGLYLAPPQNAIVLCVDEKSQIQALERTAPSLPMQPGKPATCTHDYLRHGTSTLFAALEIATGRVTAACKPRHRRQEFLAFLKQISRAYPHQELHLVHGIPYMRAGVTCLELTDTGAAAPLPGTAPTTAPIGSLIDAVNTRFGTGTVGLGRSATSAPKPWDNHQAALSPGYTTDWNALRTVS